MGVADHPRVLRVDAEHNKYLTSSLSDHPHRQLGDVWDSWWNLPEVQAASRCPQGHRSSLRLQESFILDRFVELAGSGDSHRLFTLWTELARNWGRVYEPSTEAVFHCQHSGHGGERNQRAPSLFWHLLQEASWVPARKGEDFALVRPSEGWRLTSDTPRAVSKHVPVIDSRMFEGSGLNFATTLGVVDAARPGTTDLCALLRDLRTDFEAERDDTREIQSAARWAMRALNDVLTNEGAEADLSDVPLLARFRGKLRFTNAPVVAIDPLLADTWESHYPILVADRDWRVLHEQLGLVVLDDPEHGVQITPVPYGVRDDLQATTEGLLRAAKPFLAAVAIANTPSRQDDVLRGLTRLEITACTELVLRYTFRGKTIEREEATSYIAVRQEAIRGALRRNIGTAHLEVDPASGLPDWYSFGPQLAQFLQVPTQGDAFAVLLTGSDDARWKYLTSRRVSPEDVDEMRSALDLPIEDELADNLVRFLDDVPTDSDERAGGESHATTGDFPEALEGAGDDPRSAAHEDEPLPPLDLEAITIEDVDAQGIDKQRGRRGARPAGQMVPARQTDFETTDRRQRENGKRGEEAAFDAERRRVQAAGLDPSAVVWRSRKHPTSPYDIESIDIDGQRIFIEVKATSGDDPSEPFVISEAELLQALHYRSRFYIYRVTRARTSTPRVYRYQDPARLLGEGRADLRVADARMTFGAQVEEI